MGAGWPTGSGDGRWKKNSVGLLGAKLEAERTLTAGTSARGRPKLIGVESKWNEGNPIGRNNGKTMSMPVINACNPNEVRVVHPRRVLSGHDESSVSANMLFSNVFLSAMMSSKWNAAVKDTKTFFGGALPETNAK
jgi:hypothetical protein